MQRFLRESTHLLHASQLVCLAALMLLPSRGHTQDVRGVLRADLSGAPVEGVVIAAMRAADRTIVGAR